jgi:nitrate/nitrite transporter NarK
MLRGMFGVVTRVKAVQSRTRSLVELNLELAKREVKQKATAVGIAGGLGAAAGVLVVYAIGFIFAAIAAGLSEALSLWLSLLIVALILLVLAAIAGYLAVRFVRKASPPQPTLALEEAARTVETLQSHV